MILKSFVHFVLLVFSICHYNFATSDSICDSNWVSYKDEWCYKMLDETFRHFDEAQSACAKLEGSPSLPIIKTKEEQDFLSNYLFKTSKKVENFWIGAKFSNNTNKFQWIDSTDVSFTNWDVKGPHKKENYCVEMKGEEEVAEKWIDEPCDVKKNLVVCQKLQTWSLVRLQKILLDTRKELKDSQEESKKLDDKHLATEKELLNSLSDSKIHIKNLEQNPVPIGFIYVQLPNQPEPKSIWPTVGWSQITSNYAGQFFRAEGGSSSAFGTIQEGDSPRLVNVENVWLPDANSFIVKLQLTPGQWSTPNLRTGGGANDYKHALRFLVSSAEVRPRNQAVRIWKRSS